MVWRHFVVHDKRQEHLLSVLLWAERICDWVPASGSKRPRWEVDGGVSSKSTNDIVFESLVCSSLAFPLWTCDCGLPVCLQVRVMVRIGSVPSGESSESMSFLKVDCRKKQLTLCESSAGGHSSAAQRRSTASAPKTFTFDAVFSQDASQVRPERVWKLCPQPEPHDVRMETGRIIKTHWGKWNRLLQPSQSFSFFNCFKFPMFYLMLYT